MIQAVLNPASARPKAARRPAPPAPLIEQALEPTLYVTCTKVENNSHDNSIVLMLNEWIFPRRPRLASIRLGNKYVVKLAYLDLLGLDRVGRHDSMRGGRGVELTTMWKCP